MYYSLTMKLNCQVLHKFDFKEGTILTCVRIVLEYLHILGDNVFIELLLLTSLFFNDIKYYILVYSI